MIQLEITILRQENTEEQPILSVIQIVNKINQVLFLFFHIFSRYDCHLIFEQLLTESFNQNYVPTILPKSLEKYVSFRVGCLKFFDSYQFLSSSLQKLIASLDTFKYMDSEGLTEDLFKKKLAYPYEIFNLENMSQPLNLTKKDYWSTLTQSYLCEDITSRERRKWGLYLRLKKSKIFKKSS